MKGWWIANSFRKDEPRERRVYDADEVDKEIEAKNEELAGMDIKIRFLSKDLAALKEERDRYREALELARGFLINKGYPETDPLVLGAVNKALGLEEE